MYIIVGGFCTGRQISREDFFPGGKCPGRTVRLYYCGRILYREALVQGGKYTGRILYWEDFVPGGKWVASAVGAVGTEN